MEQKYLVRIKSDVREAEFDVTGENGVCTSVRLKSLRYLKANPNSGHGEVMDAHIGNVKKCAVGKHPKSEKLGSTGQAACCARIHSRYFTGGSPSGLRV